jgi:signal transduction histidine kinase
MYIRPPHVLAAAGAATHAVHGVLDASSIDFDNGKSIALNGEWEFYWSKLLVPNDFAGGKVPNDMRYLQVPGLWKPSTSGAPMSKFGYATYRLTVIVGPGTVGKPMAIYMPSVASSYNLWVDGRLLASNGVVAASPENMVPKNYRKVVHFDADRERMEVIVQVANFVQKKGGLWEPIRFGSSERIDYERDKNIVVELFVIGCLVAMGVYHMALYGGRRRDTAPLLFGTVCLAFAVRTSVLGETMAVRLIPSLNWEYVVKVEYLTVMIGLPCYIYFCYLQYPLEMKRKWVDAGLAISGLFVLTVLLTKARTFTFIIFPFQLFAVAMFAYAIYVFVLALLRKREGAVRNIVALIVMFAAIINEILYYNHLSPWSGTLLYGLPVYLFVQSINLSNRFSRSFTRSERLSKELKELNNTLEKKVKERTAALEQSNESLQEAYHEVTLLESSRRLMLSNISHELKTPLTSILGYTRALIDGVITDNVPKYLELIYQKAKILEYTFKDLLELSKLETRKVEFHYELLPAKELLRRLFEKYEWDARNKGLIVELNEMAEPFADRETMIEADPYRIEQVFANLLMNAKKFTPPGGSIVVSAAVSEDSSGIYHLTVNVADSGPGIPEDEILLIFERFYKGKHSRKIQAEGAGLGLAISKEIMDYHRGRIGVNSRPGAGSTFYFSLPVTFAKNREL